jgi:hypothetical protein
MRSTSLGKLRANRRSDRNGAVCRLLAALGASVILGLGIGAPVAAAQSASPVPRYDGGGEASRADQRAHLRERLERRRFEQFVAEHREREHQGTQTQSNPPKVTTTPVTVPPVTVPRVTVPPVKLPNIIAPVAATPSGAAAAAATGPVSSTPARVATISAGNGGAPAGFVPPRAPIPPAAAPRTVPRSPVARALRAARSYGALLALAAAVVAFLMIQGRVDRRDPRILSAPAEDELSFRDFE